MTNHGPLAPLKSPFIWFGGKRRVASLVWDALGDVDNYVEPFAGSLAVLLGRPSWHRGQAETVNDADAYLANFWRALAHDPTEVARWADWPVNECDLFARHLWLVNEGRRRIAAMEADPDFYDAKVAGWWVWGLNAWIGSGWCRGDGPWTLAVEDQDGGEPRKRPHLGDAGRGVNRQLPHLGSAGRGVNRKLPHLGDAGRGVNRQLPHLGDAGRGVNRQLPHLGNAGREETPDGESTASFPTSETLIAYFVELAERLRRVRVCCGDWKRVVTSGALNYGTSVGVFLDPYLGDVRTADLYAVDDDTISHEVRAWALENGEDPRLRIVLAGYAEEHEAHMPASWRCLRYSASKAYGSANGGGVNEANRHKEALWFSPHCLLARPSLFDVQSAGDATEVAL